MTTIANRYTSQGQRDYSMRYAGNRSNYRVKEGPEGPYRYGAEDKRVDRMAGTYPLFDDTHGLYQIPDSRTGFNVVVKPPLPPTDYHSVRTSYTPGKVITRGIEIPNRRYTHDPIPGMMWESRNVEGLLNQTRSHVTMGFKPTPPARPSRDVGDPGSIQHPLDLSKSTPSSMDPNPIRDTNRFWTFK